MSRTFLTMLLIVNLATVCHGIDEAEEVHRRIAIINDVDVALADTVLKSCPFSHGAARRVPIVGGYRGIDDALQKKIDRLEVWLGGCIIGDEKYQVVCPVCRYYYNPYGNVWMKEGEAGDFQIPLDDALEDFKEFLAADLDMDSVHYSQRVVSRQFYEDRLGFFSRVRMAKILNKVEEYLNQKGIRSHRDQFDDASVVWYEYRLRDKGYKITVSKGAGKQTMVDFDVFHGESEQ